MSVRSHARRWVERTLHAHLIPAEQVALVFQWEHLRSFFKHFEVDCVFDVGGNVGQYAMMLRTQVGYRGDIISYEPVPELAAKLRAAAALDPRGWWRKSRSMRPRARLPSMCSPLTRSVRCMTWPRLLISSFATRSTLTRRIPVRTATLATELAKYQARLGFSRPFLKMDTQGHDVRVAMGAGSQLRSFIGLQSELAIKRLYEDAPGYEEALDYYRGQGFELSALVPNNLGHFPRLLEIDCIMYRAD